MKARSRLSKVDVAKAAFLVMEVLVIPLVFFGGCGRNSDYYGMARISPLVEQWRADVETYAEEFGVSGYVELLLAIIAQESGGDVEVTADIMQCSASAGLPGNSISDPVESIRQGVYYFSTLLGRRADGEVDMDAVIQSYNFGGGYQDFVAEVYGGVHSEEAARAFSEKMCDRYGYSFYGDVLYVEHVKSFLGGSEKQEGYGSMEECIREYTGVPYVYGGNGKYGIDCSALTQKIYKSIGITLPRTAQGQYDAVRHIPDYEARPGDLVFFTGTYESGTHITHVGLYVGNDRFFHASSGDGCCCFAYLSEAYYSEHMAGFGRP